MNLGKLLSDSFKTEEHKERDRIRVSVEEFANATHTDSCAANANTQDLIKKVGDANFNYAPRLRKTLDRLSKQYSKACAKEQTDKCAKLAANKTIYVEIPEDYWDERLNQNEAIKQIQFYKLIECGKGSMIDSSNPYIFFKYHPQTELQPNRIVELIDLNSNTRIEIFLNLSKTSERHKLFISSTDKLPVITG